MLILLRYFGVPRRERLVTPDGFGLRRQGGVWALRGRVWVIDKYGKGMPPFGLSRFAGAGGVP